MKLNYSIIQWMILLILSLGFQLEAGRTVYDIRNFGAVPGTTDISKALKTAWERACRTSGENVILIPKLTYLLRPVIFAGPCQGKMIILLNGVLKAFTDDASTFTQQWIAFEHVSNLEISGGGSLDGQGYSSWSKNDCRTNPNCKKLATSITFSQVKNSYIHNIASMNSKSAHVAVFGCEDVVFDGLTIRASGVSPNTDGMDIARSRRISVTNSNIGTGDDCIALGPGSKFINITNVNCGPGHGISIGSLGRTPNEDAVSNVQVRQCTFTRTQNGLRIKTWSPSYGSLVNHIRYEDIRMVDVFNPILIDQNYCPSGHCGQNGESRVQIKDISFDHIWGRSASKVAINLQCSKRVPCQGLVLKDIQLPHNGNDGPSISMCSNAKGVALGKHFPRPCLM